MNSSEPLLFGEKRNILTVSELTRQIKLVLSDSFRQLRVSGEVSNLTYHGSGHVYLTLKDEAAAIRCVMWRRTAAKLRFRIEEGSEIVVLGSLSVYEVRGDYQLVVTYAEPKGVGALALAFEQLKKKLATEGLFEESHKKPLPFLPRRIGVVTSATGAAIRDIIQTILSRFPRAHVILLPARVQGEGAAQEIASAIKTFDEMNEVNVIIAGRGGGSLEDLWPFNEEIVARAIYGCRIPIISAVGHEIDITISDYVADARAPTPTAAGEMVVPVEADLQLALMQLHQRLALALRNMLERRRHELDRLTSSYAFRRPFEYLQQRAQQLDDLWRRLSREVESTMDARRRTLEGQKQHLEGLNPLNVLARGYSITTIAGSCEPLTDVSSVKKGDAIETVLAKGKIVSKVERVRKGEN